MTKKGEIDILVISNEQHTNRITEIAKKFSDKFNLTCYVSTNKLYDSLIEDLKEENIPTNKFFFIDAVTRSVNPKAEEGKNCLFVRSPADLTKISLIIDKLLATKKVGGLIFDSLSTLLIYNKNKIVSKFVHNLINKIKKYNVSATLAVSKGDESTQLLDELSVYGDNIIHHKEEGRKEKEEKLEDFTKFLSEKT